MVGSLISLSRVPLAPAGAEPEPSISLRGDDGTAPGVDSGWPELSDPAAMMNSSGNDGTPGNGGGGGVGGPGEPCSASPANPVRPASPAPPNPTKPTRAAKP